MQETQFDGRKLQEFFSARTDNEVIKKMDKRLKVLEAGGHTLTKRVKIGRNESCPCGSGKKFKKCCIHKIT